MIDLNETIKRYLKEVKTKHNIDMKVRSKSKSKLLKILRPVLELFNKDYWDGYITTIGTTIWVPEQWTEETGLKSQLEIIMHEVIHAKQAKKTTQFGFKILYLFPQVLSVLSLLSLLAIPFSNMWLLCLLFLLCLAPLPAPFRYLFELQAYRTTLVFDEYARATTPRYTQMHKDFIIKNLSKGAYYFAWPFPKSIQKHLDRKEKLNNKFYSEEKDFLKKEGLLKK